MKRWHVFDTRKGDVIIDLNSIYAYRKYGPAITVLFLPGGPIEVLVPKIDVQRLVQPTYNYDVGDD